MEQVDRGRKSEVRDQRTTGRFKATRRHGDTALLSRQVAAGRGQEAGWLIRKLENWKISKKDELFTAYCAKRPEPVEGLTAYRLPLTIYRLRISSCLID